jgi:TolB protein
LVPVLPLCQIMIEEDQVDPQPTPPKEPRRISLRPVTVILSLTAIMLLLMVWGMPYLQTRYDLPWEFPQADQTTEITPTLLDETPTPELQATSTSTVAAQEASPGFWMGGTVILSIQQGLDSHLYAYNPLVEMGEDSSPLTQLTGGSWDDITPALSPNQDQLAFASNRDGYWDIHTLDLSKGEIASLTDSPDYEASPSFSPDGLWLAYEGYVGDNLEVLIRPVDGSQDPIQLSNHFAADYQPAWSPTGRQIAFVSTRGGGSHIWLANLDESGDERFIKLSGHAEASAAYPAWSPDGRYLAWGAVTEDGLHHIYLWDNQEPEVPARENGSGDWAVWSPDGSALLVVLLTPYHTYLTAYPIDQIGSVILPPVRLPGPVSGLVWADGDRLGALQVEALPTPTPLWQPNIDLGAGGAGNRWELEKLDDVVAPYPRLHDRVNESFQALRRTLGDQVGWDLLAELENAYIPLSSALPPGLVENWLYTGRGFSFNTLPIEAGWMTVVREDFGQSTYWRVFLRARYQDGTQGKPLQELPWDFNARYSGNPRPYDQGGELAAVVPAGYWVDMTQLAAVFEWERQPALANWRAAYRSARFNEFIKTDGLDWVSAMLEIYPPEVLLTLTPLPTPTPSQTPAPLWYKSPTPTLTASLTPTPTMTSSATAAASPTKTDTPTGAPVPSSTPTPTATPSGTGTATP